jgi:hypothetical protein
LLYILYASIYSIFGAFNHNFNKFRLVLRKMAKKVPLFEFENFAVGKRIMKHSDLPRKGRH